MPKKLKNLSRTVLYATKKKRKTFFVLFFGPTDTILRLPSSFLKLLLELFWSLRVYRKQKHRQKVMTIVDSFLKKSAD